MKVKRDEDMKSEMTQMKRDMKTYKTKSGVILFGGGGVPKRCSEPAD